MQYALLLIMLGNLFISVISCLATIYFSPIKSKRAISIVDLLWVQCFVSLAVAFIAALFLEPYGFA